MERSVSIRVDQAADAAYIDLQSGIVHEKVAKTYPCDPNEINGQINLDFDAGGRLIGIEILDASRLLQMGTSFRKL